MRLLDKAYVCMGGEGFYIFFFIAPAQVPFCPLLCSMPVLGYFSLTLWLSMCLLCVCMCLCGVVGLLSLFISGSSSRDDGRMATQQRSGRATIAGLQLWRC
jgi:hypothetical protein